MSIKKNKDLERNLGLQPIASIMAEFKLKPNDLVSNSSEQISHKMVNKAVKGRRLNPHIQIKILKAVNNTTKKSYSLKDLFNY